MERSGMRPHRPPQCPTEVRIQVPWEDPIQSRRSREPMRNAIKVSIERNKGIFQGTTGTNAERNKGTKEDES